MRFVPARFRDNLQHKLDEVTFEAVAAILPEVHAIEPERD